MASARSPDNAGRLEETDRTAAALRECGADWAVLTSPDAVCYATGHIVPVETGPSPFAGGPTVAFVSRDGVTGIVAANVEPAARSAIDVGQCYAGFSYADANDVEQSFAAALQSVASQLGIGGVIAVEPSSFTAAIANLLAPVETRSIVPMLTRARQTKTAREIRKLTASAAVAAVGQCAAILETRADRTELEIFAAVREAMERSAGERLPVAGDFISGVERTSRTSGWPIEQRLNFGDPVVCDLAPRVDGYWGDSCGSFAVGEASAGFQKLFAASREALETALDLARPGLAIDVLDARLRAVVDRHGFAYPHHSGHSIGTAVHEHPRIVPHETTRLEAGMVMMLEPSAYHPDYGGARLEYMVLIEADGCRPMAPFDHVLTVP